MGKFKLFGKFTLPAATAALLLGSPLAQADGLKWQQVDPEAMPPGLDSLLIDHPSVQNTDDRYRVVTNRFWDNWFVFADAGLHTFRGDWSGYGNLKHTLSPDFNIGVGKWFTPGFGINFQFGMGSSRGFTGEWTPYAVGNESEPMLSDDGSPYWKMETKWRDVNANVMLNLTRMIGAWEGYDTRDASNQFILSIGVGGVHHYDNPQGNWNNNPLYADNGLGKMYGDPHNEWFGNFELQYSRFFTKAKAISLDVKMRLRLYETHFDLTPLEDRRWDYNLGLNLGITYYFKERGWGRCRNCSAPDYYISMPPAEPATPTYVTDSECKTFVFYIFYPNNYSGRNDAPVVESAEVNSMDYLAGGIFTQKAFKDGSAAEKRLRSGASLRSLKTRDIPTEKATFTENTPGVPRGYEMTPAPISLSMSADSLRAFAGRTGYFYAPIYENNKTWNYRIDNETRTQTLLSRDNYMEDTSYCINAHAGLDIVRKHMENVDGADVYSFADVYAAIEGNEGHVAQCADSTAVEEIRRILRDGNIILVQAEGVATSQDNYTGANAEEVGYARNKALSFNRAWSAIKWLRGSGSFEGVKRENFVINTLTDPISTVNDKSTRSLNAKLNRCARIRITYVIKNTTKK